MKRKRKSVKRYIEALLFVTVLLLGWRYAGERYLFTSFGGLWVIHQFWGVTGKESFA